MGESEMQMRIGLFEVLPPPLFDRPPPIPAPTATTTIDQRPGDIRPPPSRRSAHRRPCALLSANLCTPEHARSGGSEKSNLATERWRSDRRGGASNDQLGGDEDRLGAAQGILDAAEEQARCSPADLVFGDPHSCQWRWKSGPATRVGVVA